MSLLYINVAVEFKTCALNTENGALVKSSMKIFFQILWPSQKPQTLKKTLLMTVYNIYQSLPGSYFKDLTSM